MTNIPFKYVSYLTIPQARVGKQLYVPVWAHALYKMYAEDMDSFLAEVSKAVNDPDAQMLIASEIVLDSNFSELQRLVHNFISELRRSSNR